MEDLRRTALRVPSVLQGKWVYLRTWSIYSGEMGERTHSNHIHVVVANQTGGWIIVTGLEPVVFNDRGSFEANRLAVDEYLLALGAEPVPSHEWPESSEGHGARADRTPFRHTDWDETDAVMKAKGYKGVFDHTPSRQV